MILGKYTKQPAEVLDYDIDFSKFLEGNDTILSVGDPAVPSPLTVSVYPAGLTLGSTFVREGSIVKQWISGGTDGERYKVSITVSTNAGRTKQVEFIVKVKDE